MAGRSDLRGTVLTTLSAGTWRVSALIGPEGDFDGLFAVGRHRGAALGILGEVDDPEVDLRLDPTGAGSNTVTFAEP
jgi:hypothetical protein